MSSLTISEIIDISNLIKDMISLLIQPSEL